MADIGAANWSETDSSNNSTPPNGWPSSVTLPSQVEPGLRAMMGAIRRFWDRINGTLTSTGSANVHVLTYTVAPPAYVTGEVYRFIAGFTNSGPATLNVNALGAKAIQYQGAALVGNEIVAGRVATVVYDGTQFQLATSQIDTTNASNLSSGTLALARGGTGAGTQSGAFTNTSVVTSTISQPGYIKFPNGLILQWGLTVSLGGGSSIAVTFPIAFSSTVTVTVTMLGDTVHGINVQSGVTTTGFTAVVNNSAGSTGQVYWFAIGS